MITEQTKIVMVGREQTKIVMVGRVDWDVYGSWSDCSPGLYIGQDKVESVVGRLQGKNVKVTIEEIAPDESSQ